MARQTIVEMHQYADEQDATPFEHLRLILTEKADNGPYIDLEVVSEALDPESGVVLYSADPVPVTISDNQPMRDVIHQALLEVAEAHAS